MRRRQARPVNESGRQRRPGHIPGINPQQVVPTIDDNGFILWESRAINSYLVTKYGGYGATSLLPVNTIPRAKVEQMLYFDIGTLYASMIKYFRPQLREGQPPNPQAKEELDKSLGLLDTLLVGRRYVAGTCARTLADISLLASVTQLEGYDYSYNNFCNVVSWVERMKGEVESYHEVSDEGLEKSRQWLEVIRAVEQTSLPLT